MGSFTKPETYEANLPEHEGGDRVVDDKGQKIDTRLAYDWMGLDKIIEHCSHASRKELKDVANAHRTYEKADNKRNNGVGLMTMRIRVNHGGRTQEVVATYFVDSENTY